MIKKIIVGVVVVGISAGLIYGGVYRTISRSEIVRNSSQSKNDQLNNHESSDTNYQGRVGQNGNISNRENDKTSKGENLSNEQINPIKESTDLVSYTGIASELDESHLVILCEEGGEIRIDNRPWEYATSAGFLVEIGDYINVNGFYETTDEYEVAFMQNLTNGIEVQIRESSGRPLWAGNGRDSYK